MDSKAIEFSQYRLERAKETIKTFNKFLEKDDRIIY